MSEAVQEMLSVAEAARRLHETQGRIFYWIRQGKLPGAVQLSAQANGTRPWRIPAAALDGFVKPRRRKYARLNAAKVEDYKARSFKLSPAEHDRAYELFCEQLDICDRRSIEPPQTWDEALAEWESIPQTTRQEMLWPEPAEMRPLYTARYRAYETPRGDYA